jgi:hypothetical protein
MVDGLGIEHHEGLVARLILLKLAYLFPDRPIGHNPLQIGKHARKPRQLNLAVPDPPDRPRPRLLIPINLPQQIDRKARMPLPLRIGQRGQQ